jgi:hypothetical protein
MRRIFSVLAVVVLLCPGLAPAQDGVPSGSPPTLVPVRIGTNADEVSIPRVAPVQEVRTVTEQVPRVVQVQQGGQVVNKVEYVPVTKQMVVTVTKIVPANYKLKDVAFYNLKGLRLTDEQVRKALGTKFVPILVGQAQAPTTKRSLAGIDPFYLRAFRDDTMVVVLPDSVNPSTPIPLPEKLPRVP